MLAMAVLPRHLSQSVLLAVVAGYAASHFRKASPGLLLGVVLAISLSGRWENGRRKEISGLPHRISGLVFRACCFRYSGACYSLTASFVSNTIPIDF